MKLSSFIMVEKYLYEGAGPCLEELHQVQLSVVILLQHSVAEGGYFLEDYQVYGRLLTQKWKLNLHRYLLATQ